MLLYDGPSACDCECDGNLILHGVAHSAAVLEEEGSRKSKNKNKLGIISRYSRAAVVAIRCTGWPDMSTCWVRAILMSGRLKFQTGVSNEAEVFTTSTSQRPCRKSPFILLGGNSSGGR